MSESKNPSTSTAAPKLFRVTIEVSSLEDAASFYTKLFGIAGKRHPGARHYFDCGDVIVAVLDVSQGGLSPTPGPKSLYFAVSDIAAVHARAKALKALAPFLVHGQKASDVLTRPWGEKSFYVTDPWGNELCFVEDGTLYT
jgi:catechol 2,3-dioxygenase-like lactoylglutathione lyase family enzyme